ncbi:hypothetical protein [Xanthomonas perforans]|uniref:hypothetical protein n=1 Tax=Xanthomonas perforans TaxID=442694 RepID=UPI001F1A6898|nr:hypothetical protein [Xanthomonas perforans]MCF5929636.1 hypothetical protein [Xanthomonas perforans]
MEIQQRIEAFKKMLLANGIERTMNELILRHDCSIIGGSMESSIRTEIADYLDVETEEVIIVGSAKLGFSPKPGQCFKPFDEASDIDVAIVSPELFAAIWHEVLDMKAGGAFIKDIQGFQHYHFQGWMRPDKMPASSTYHRCRDWWEFFLSLSKKEEYDRRPIRGGLYYDTSFLSRYQTTALAQIQRQISKSNP